MLVDFVANLAGQSASSRRRNLVWTRNSGPLMPVPRSILGERTMVHSIRSLERGKSPDRNNFSATLLPDLHVTTTEKHDSKIAPSLIERNTDEVAILLGHEGYDDRKVRALAREGNPRPLIKHREFSSRHTAWNARLDAGLSGQRSQSETEISRLKRKYGAFVRPQRW